MITYRFSNGKSCPVVVCDACNKNIDASDPHYGGAMQMWDSRLEDGRKEGSLFSGRIYHAHIGKCWDKVDLTIQSSGGYTYDMNIEIELSRLLHNSGFDAGKDVIETVVARDMPFLKPRKQITQLNKNKEQ